MKEKKFEDMLGELETLVKKLESGDTDLDTSIEIYQKAMKLAKECGDKLNSAEEAVNKILSEDGSLKDFHIENA
ncbi:exodeoxyribonuclease 7 small subunit [Clostridium sp. CAG:533]|nr:exodeoxyribonuclease 7 small subunit [Clostridium sp. CAG:533]